MLQNETCLLEAASCRLQNDMEMKDAEIKLLSSVADIAKLQAVEKEEEVKLLERSVEELECTVNVLENEVEFVSGKAEQQWLQREKLDMELHAIKKQMKYVKGSYADMRRHQEEKEKSLQEACQRIQLLEGEIISRDAELAHCKANISELKKEEFCKLRQLLKERKGWIEEIERKQVEMVAAQIALEKLRRRNHLLTAEYEMIKMENVNHKKKVIELEADIKKLSSQQKTFNNASTVMLKLRKRTIY
ncbi:hypothetical protein AABB24_023431 [Solanum stoloniferum]|uniref:Uncharacterized protein n=1 Tax=Solanum stoloniferum TaxID=62892 RepID=A0ABD2T483_9SOLN